MISIVAEMAQRDALRPSVQRLGGKTALHRRRAGERRQGAGAQRSVGFLAGGSGNDRGYDHCEAQPMAISHHGSSFLADDRVGLGKPGERGRASSPCGCSRSTDLLTQSCAFFVPSR